MRERTGFHFAMAVGLFLLVTAAPGSAAKAPAGEQCASAKAWAWLDAYHGPLPSTLEELARYPVAQRMVILTSLDPQTRSRIWREHFQRHLDQDANLTSDQRAVLEDALALFSPELFSTPGDHAGNELPALLERAKKAFGRDRGIALLTVVNPGGTPVPAYPNCACATSPGDTCKTYCDDTADCTPTRLGCGPGGVYACNGMCAPAPPPPPPMICGCAGGPGDICGPGAYCQDTVACAPTDTGCGSDGHQPCTGICVLLNSGTAN